LAGSKGFGRSGVGKDPKVRKLLYVSLRSLLRASTPSPQAKRACRSQTLSMPSRVQAGGPRSGRFSRQGLWEKPGAVTESFPTRVRRSISRKSGTKAPSEKSYQFVYAKTACNIRRGPGTTYSITRKATKGERLEYISRKGNWYKLKGGKGKPQEWVHKNVVIPPEDLIPKLYDNLK